jgi:hypothetical protein
VPAAAERLHRHPPVGHLDADDVELAPEQRPQRHVDDDFTGHEERRIGRRQAADEQVADNETPVEDPQ